MKRDEWTFPYPAAVVASGAWRKARHHRQRVHWWEKQKANVMRQIKAKGMDVDEGLAAQYSSNVSAPHVRIRIDLAARLSEAHGKVKEHEGKARAYEGWHTVLKAQPKQMQLHLSHEDYLFFFA